MTKEIKLRICGMHMHGPDGEQDDVEVVSVGQMCERDGFACITYDEVVEEEENGLVQVAKNMIKYKEGQLEVVKRGPSESHMVFVPDRTTYTYYSTPMGELEIGLYTKSLEKVMTEKGFHLRLAYDLEMNQTFLSHCNLDIFVEE